MLRARNPSAAFRRFAAPALFWLLFAVIVSISRPLASAEAGKCLPPKGVLGNYEAQRPPSPATDMPFFDAAGARLSLADYRGRGVVLNLWATWCAPCIRELPQLDRLKGLLGGDGIEVLALSEDRGGAALIDEFYRLNGIGNLAVLLDRGGKVLRDSKIKGLPTTLLIGAGGREVGRVVGGAEWDSPAATAFLRRCLGR